ncbi:MAG: N-acetyltransferase [Ignavibacteria bacterium]|nr:MAG: N-acetyltransferase [Ignavibacteria bacterium]
MIRRLKKTDRPQLKKIIDSVELFNEEEKEVAIELIDEAIINEEQDYYNIFVYEENKKLLGYHCTGKRSLTDGVFDLYWIVVDPDSQGKGIGKKLLEHAEEFVRDNNGRLVWIETSAKEEYKDTQNFYLKNGYSQLARIKDFYKVGDDLIIFGKYIIT